MKGSWVSPTVDPEPDQVCSLLHKLRFLIIFTTEGNAWVIFYRDSPIANVLLNLLLRDCLGSPVVTELISCLVSQARWSSGTKTRGRWEVTLRWSPELCDNAHLIKGERCHLISFTLELLEEKIKRHLPGLFNHLAMPSNYLDWKELKNKDHSKSCC